MELKRWFSEIQRDEQEKMRGKVPEQVWQDAVRNAERVVRGKEMVVLEGKGGDIVGEEKGVEGDLMDDAEMVEREEVESELGFEEETVVRDENHAQRGSNAFGRPEFRIIDSLPSESVNEVVEATNGDNQLQDDTSDYGDLEIVESVTFVEFDGVLV